MFLEYAHCCVLLYDVICCYKVSTLLHFVECTCCTDSEFYVDNSYTTITVANKGKVTFYYCCNELTLASGHGDLF